VHRHVPCRFYLFWGKSFELLAELGELGGRIDRLQGLVRALCEERIEALAAAA